MKTALITGFETFGLYIFNPSKWLALAAEGKLIAGYRIHSLVLPSTVLIPEGVEDPGTKIVRIAEEIRADIIISFGISSEVKGFQLERSASNWVYNKKYLSPEENNRALNTLRPPKEQVQIDLSQVDLEKLQNLFLEAQIPFDSKISDDPGQYSCNALIYRTQLALQKESNSPPALFVHMACTEETVELISDFNRVDKLLIKKEDTIKALDFILQSIM